jgi:hypothetical protein
MFGRILLGLALCLNAASDGAGGGGGGTTTGQPPAGGTPPQPATPPVDAKKIADEARATARAEFLKEQGFADEDAYKKHLDDKKKADEAKLSEGERQKRALEEALTNHKTAEDKLKATREELKTEREERRIEKLFYAAGVRPEAQTVARALYDEKKKADPNAKDEEVFAKMREEWPNVFGPASPQPANTGPTTPAASPFGNGPTPPSGGEVDALHMTDAQYTQFRNNGYRA